MALTKEGRRSLSTFFTMGRSELQGLEATDSNGNMLKSEDWEVSKVINLSFCIAHLKTKKIFSFNDLDRDAFESFKAKRDITTLRPPISSLLPTEAAPVHEESTFKSYFRSTLQPGSEMSNRTAELKLENKDEVDNNKKGY